MNARPALVTLLLLSLASRAAAQDDLTGSWHASPLRIRYAVSEWGPDCGPRPPAQTTESGGAVQVAQRGDDLTFSGAVRWTTNTCASETPGLRRVASSYRSGHWTTRCQTPNGHAHPERGVYRLTARDDGSLRYTETTNWNWALRTSTCVATRTGTRSFTRPEAAAPPPDTTMDAPEPTPRCTAGPAARIQLRPREGALEPGGRQCFRARVLDAAGCPVAGRRVVLRVKPGSGARGRMEGRCFVAAGSAAEAEGTAEILATSEDLRASARLRIAPTDLTGLRAQGGAGPQLAGGGSAEAHSASGVSARVGESGVPWLAIVAGAGVLLLLVLGLVLLLLRRRGSRRSPSTASEPATSHAPEPERVRTSPPQRAEVLAAPAEPQENLICPKCRRGYPAGSRFCPNDSETLISYADFRARAEPRDQERVCTTCGARYPADTTFCGKDGTPLADS